MRNLPWLCVCVLLGAANLAAGLIQFQVTALPAPGEFRYNYTLSGFNLLANQEVDIQFPAASFSMLKNGVAPSNFTLNLFQPNNPLGVQGDYSAVSKINNPPLTGPFSVDVTYTGAGQPGSQPYQINDFNGPNNTFTGTIESGVTTPAGPTGIPEPGSISLVVLGLGGGVAAVFRRRRIAITCTASRI